MSIFYCRNCDIDFENSKPEKKEYRDQIYGYCWKYIAYCPSCEAECSEKPTPKLGKKKQAPTQDFPGGGCCPAGGCCGIE